MPRGIATMLPCRSVLFGLALLVVAHCAAGALAQNVKPHAAAHGDVPPAPPAPAAPAGGDGSEIPVDPQEGTYKYYMEQGMKQQARMPPVPSAHGVPGPNAPPPPPPPPSPPKVASHPRRLPQYPSFAFKGSFLPRQLNVVRKAFEDIGFAEVKEDDPEGWTTVWGTGGAFKKTEFDTFLTGQKFNHFPCTFELGNKDTLYKNLNRARAGLGDDGGYDFFPLTFLMPEDKEYLKAVWAKNPKNMYILKPKFLARGEGIRMLQSIEDLDTVKDLGDFLVQHYLVNPLLVDGKKHTLRVYIAATSITPLRLYWLDNGFVHLASEPYTLDPAQFGNIRVHVTNPDVQGSEYQSAGGGSNYWNLTRFYDMLEKHPTLDAKKVWSDVEAMLVKTVLSAQDMIDHCIRTHSAPDRHFEVWGLDIMIDDQGKPWVIEVNHTPSTNTDFPAAKQIKYNFVYDLLRMVFPTDEERDKWTNAVFHRLQRIGWDIESLPDVALKALVDTELEYQISREGHYRRIYPSSMSVRTPYPRVDDMPYLDQLLAKWVETWLVDAEHIAKNKQA